MDRQKEVRKTFFDIGTFRAIFCQKTNFGAIFGSKNSNLKIERSRSFFDLETSPLSILLPRNHVKWEENCFLKILIFVIFLIFGSIFPKNRKITIIVTFYLIFVCRTKKYMPREAFMPNIGGVFFCHPSIVCQSEVF